MTLTQVTPDIIRRHIGVTNEDDKVIEMYWDAAVSQTLNYTGLTVEQADALPDVTVATLALCSDMYMYRNAADGGGSLNPTVQCILDMHRRNLL